MTTSLGWGGILRLALVQAALGAMVVLATSTMNRIMVVELAMPATLPGFLVALHYAIQVVRPRLGHGSDLGGRCLPWIRGGMCVLALGTLGAAGSIALMQERALAGVLAAVIAYGLIGIGVGAAGTALLVLLARSVAPQRRAAAATLTWIMMFVGFVVSTVAAGQLLAPYSHARLLRATLCISAAALAIALLAARDMERGAQPQRTQRRAAAPGEASGGAFRAALAAVWADPVARRFTLFVFMSMLAYSGQELVLEPFCGAVLGLDPAHSTRVSALQHGGALGGMVLMALAGSLLARSRFGSLRGWIVGGCLASAAVLAMLALAAAAEGAGWPLRAMVVSLGVANGAFAVAAIGTMMSLAAAGPGGRPGLRMGLWGGAQALAFAFGGIAVTAAVDIARHLLGTPAAAYASVFALEAALFVASGLVAAGLDVQVSRSGDPRPAGAVPGPVIAGG